jgi:hypothetical protein|nr:MAG TPA: hypothetical protein [Caudoviricetes sp.]
MAKKDTFTVVNTGVCVIVWKGESYLPGAEFELKSEDLEKDGIVYLISKGKLEVKDNSKLNNEIKEKDSKKRRKDPTEGKTKAELENGGEF